MTRAVGARLVIAALWLLPPPASGQAPPAPLRVQGRHFVDPAGRVVVLRGVNLAGDSKVPPFVPVDDPRQLDPLMQLGLNVVRLVISWEALEPRPGVYDARYLGRMGAIASACVERGMYVVVDVHQDGFSRYLSKGSGDGFPAWAASPRSRLHEPDNGPKCANWPIKMAFDPGMHRSFADFYSDANGVRTRYLRMVQKLAGEFVAIPGVIGYDLLNEPWGYERSELAPLYADAARAIHAVHAGAIVFVEGHVSTNMGFQTRLPRPDFAGVAYAPHYYKPTVILAGTWRGHTGAIDRAFAHMNSKAEEWCVPLFVSEFGAPAEARRAGDYVAYLYDRLDETFASGAQWNYTPHWGPEAKDGWNGEDFHILAPSGHLRGNFRARPFPRAIAGTPIRFRYEEGTPSTVEVAWDARPDLGETEIFLPIAVFPIGSAVRCDPPEMECRHDAARQVLMVRALRPGRVRVRVEGARQTEKPYAEAQRRGEK